MVSEYRVLYTHQKKRKSKIWQDGTLVFNKQGVKGTLLSDDGQTLDVIFTRHHCIGAELETDRYLVTIEEEISHRAEPIQQQQQQPVEQNQQNHHYTRRQLYNKRPCSPDYNCPDQGGHSKRSASQILELLYPGKAAPSQQLDQSLPSPSPPHSNVFTLYPDMTSSSFSTSCSQFPPPTTSIQLQSEEQGTVPLQPFLLPGQQIRPPTAAATAAGSGLVSSHTVERCRSPEKGRWSHYLDSPVEAVTAGYWCPSSPIMPPPIINHEPIPTVTWDNSETYYGEQPLPAGTSCRRPSNLFPRSSASSPLVAATMHSQNSISSFSKEANSKPTSSLPRRFFKHYVRSSSCMAHEITIDSFTKRPVSSISNESIETEYSLTRPPNASISYQQRDPATSPPGSAITPPFNITTSFLSREATRSTADQQLLYRKLCPITADPSEFTNKHYHSPVFSSKSPVPCSDTRHLLTESHAIESQLPKQSNTNALTASPVNSSVYEFSSDADHKACSPQRLGEVSHIVLNDSLELSDVDGPAILQTTPCTNNPVTAYAVSSDEEEEEMPVRNRSDFKLGLWEFSSDSEP